jgi:SlyX protein
MSTSSTGTESRLAALEERLAHQDHAIHELSSELYRQQQQIADLELHLGRLRDRLEPLEQAVAADDPGHEIPPHY